MLNKIHENLTKHNLLEYNEKVIVGFSGGADSACLLYSLKQLNYNVYALHVHHGIRGDEADRDAIFARKFCLNFNIPYFEEKINIPQLAQEKKLSLETCARQERYKLLNVYAEKYNAKIAVAHNKNDQVETVLMHLLRGSSLNGLCGMQFKTNNIIRPLLNISREDIENFNNENNIEYINDSTNFCDDYSRNKLRLNIIPQLNSSFNVDCISSIFNCAESLSEYNAYINENVNEYAKKYISKENNEIILKCTDLPHIIQIELIKKSIEQLNGNVVDIEKVHLEDVCSLFEKESGKEVHLPYEIKAKKVYDSVHFFKNVETFSAEYFFEPKKEFYWDKFKINSSFTDVYKKEKNCEFIDFQKLPQDLTLRTRNEGDYIYPLGLNGKCTLKKYFIDKKIPVNLRNSIPLLAKGNEIFAIIGYTVSDKVKITSNSKKILKISLENT